MKYKSKLIWIGKSGNESIHFERKLTKKNQYKDYLVVRSYGMGGYHDILIPVKKVDKALQGQWEADQQERNERMKQK